MARVDTTEGHRRRGGRGRGRERGLGVRLGLSWWLGSPAVLGCLGAGRIIVRGRFCARLFGRGRLAANGGQQICEGQCGVFQAHPLTRCAVVRGVGRKRPHCRLRRLREAARGPWAVVPRSTQAEQLCSPCVSPCVSRMLPRPQHMRAPSNPSSAAATAGSAIRSRRSSAWCWPSYLAAPAGWLNRSLPAAQPLLAYAWLLLALHTRSASAPCARARTSLPVTTF